VTELPAGSPYANLGEPSFPRPKDVDRAFWAAIGYALYVVLFCVVSLGSSSAIAELMRRQAEQRGQVPNPAVIAQVSAFLPPFAIGFGVVVGALWVFFAVRMRAGRNWARIVLVVLATLGVMSAFGNVVRGLLVVESLPGLVLAAAVSYLLFRPAANRYFRAR
jgi:uncharacterized membrane protein (UPF0136 family)